MANSIALALAYLFSSGNIKQAWRPSAKAAARKIAAAKSARQIMKNNKRRKRNSDKRAGDGISMATAAANIRRRNDIIGI